MVEARRERSGSGQHAVGRLALALALVVLHGETSSGLITGGTGNAPLSRPGWPQGAAEVFNHSSRIAWWEGPPFGGGQYHAEYRGDTAAFQGVLERFARLDVATKRIIIQDGTGQSFWLNPNGSPEKAVEAQIDWSFMFWNPENWQRLKTMPSDLQPPDVAGAEQAPAILNVYTGGHVDWSQVAVPSGLVVTDHRLQAHGFAVEDATVLEGQVVAIDSGQPLRAQIELQQVQPQQSGGYEFMVLQETTTDDQGRWVVKNAPPQWLRVVVKATGYAPRVAGYLRVDEQPRWYSYDCGLAPCGQLSGQVMDAAGGLLDEVDVRLANVIANAPGSYEGPSEYIAKTDLQGRFGFDCLPVGSATVRVSKSGYCREGLGESITIPTDNVRLVMVRAAQVTVTVQFPTAQRPDSYIVELAPAGGSAVGKWSGSGNINAQNQIVFQNIPPGQYVLRGHPNPTTDSQRTEPQSLDLQGGQTIEITLHAR